jgi:hypothetical protein
MASRSRSPTKSLTGVWKCGNSQDYEKLHHAPSRRAPYVRTDESFRLKFHLKHVSRQILDKTAVFEHEEAPHRRKV